MYSIVIPVYNEEKYIGRCLQSVANIITSEAFEVIVVDNNSTDDSIKEIEKYTSHLNLLLVQEKQKGRGAARKKGFDVAKGSIIFSTDADTIVPPNWFTGLTKHLEDKGISVVTGNCRLTDCGTVMNFMHNTLYPYVIRIYKVFYGTYWLNGFNFAIRKDMYTKSGGFDGRLNAQEDTDLSFKLAKLGKIYFDKDSVVEYSGRRYKKGFLKAILSYIKSFISYYYHNDTVVLLPDVR